MRKTHYRTWNMAKKLKIAKMRHKLCRTWNLARKIENRGKMRNAYCRTWSMARKLKIMENEKPIL
jgi:hypothetical protein